MRDPKSLVLPSIALFSALTFAIPAISQNPAEESASEIGQTIPLEAGKRIEHDLKADGVDSYEIRMTMRQCAQVLVQPQGMDVAVKLISPDGGVLRVESRYGVQDPLEASVLVSKAGVYRLEVSGTDNNALDGHYKIRVEGVHAATARDLARVKAQGIFAEGQRLHEEGTADSRRAALVRFEEAVALWRSAGDSLGEAQTLEQMGSLLNDLFDNQRALRLLQQSLKIFKSVGDRRGEAIALSDLGSVYSDLGNNPKGLRYLNEAILINIEVGDRLGEAETLVIIGVTYDSLGQELKALDYFNRSLSIRRSVGDRRGEADTLTQVGLVYYNLDQDRKALDYYAQASRLRQSLHDQWREAETLNDIASTYDTMGEKEKAFEYLNKALPLKRATGNTRGEAVTLSNMGSLSFGLGEWQDASDQYKAALIIDRTIGERKEESITLSRIGMLYDALGERQTALGYFGDALSIARHSGYRTLEGTILNNMGLVFYELDDHPQALAYLDLSLHIRRTVGDRVGEAATLCNIGKVYDASGEQRRALDFFNQGLSVARAAENRQWEAAALNGIGSVYSTFGDSRNALGHFHQALTLSETLGDKRAEASIRYGMARTERENGKLTNALDQMEAVLEIVESLRTQIISPQLRASYFASVREYYEFYIDLLMQLHQLYPVDGYDRKAFEASERSRARSLLETLQEARADIRQGIDQKLLEREHSLQQLLDGKTNRQMQLLANKSSEQQAAAVTKEIEELLSAYQEVEAQIRATSPRYAALTQPEPSTLAEIQKWLLDPDTMLLEYSLGNRSSYLWVVTSTSLTSFRLAKRSDIQAAARQVYELLTAPNRLERHKRAQREKDQLKPVPKYQEKSIELSRMILEPVAGLIRGKRLLVVADGALQYVPFAILTSPNVDDTTKTFVPLIAQHEIINLPSASIIGLLRQQLRERSSPPKAVAVIADPVFDSSDPRVTLKKRLDREGKKARTERQTAPPLAAALMRSRLTRSIGEVGMKGERVHLPRLVFTRQEAISIMAATPTGEGMKALDFQASRATATGADLARYRIVHFATHGLLDSEHPELSGLILSLVDEAGNPENGFLDLHDVYNLNLPAELVVLSACETGLGKEVNGEGLIGLTRGFMYAGAPRVVASLWKVDDRSTGELMAHFYKGMLREGLRPAAALRQAQVEMWKQERWADPYYWAAFTIQGEWK